MPQDRQAQIRALKPVLPVLFSLIPVHRLLIVGKGSETIDTLGTDLH